MASFKRLYDADARVLFVNGLYLGGSCPEARGIDYLD
jgi:hypothetical protein